MSDETFEYWGVELPYLTHLYNMRYLDLALDRAVGGGRRRQTHKVATAQTSSNVPDTRLGQGPPGASFWRWRDI